MVTLVCPLWMDGWTDACSPVLYRQIQKGSASPLMFFLNILLSPLPDDVLNFQFYGAAWAVNGNPWGSREFMCVTVVFFFREGVPFKSIVAVAKDQRKKGGETRETHSQLLAFKWSKRHLRPTEYSTVALKSVVILRPSSLSIIGSIYCYIIAFFIDKEKKSKKVRSFYK